MIDTAAAVTSYGDVAVLRIDDGKANALSPELVASLHMSLDGAIDADGLVILGRPGRFCAGFDLRVMNESPEAADELVRAGAELLLRIYAFPCPVVAGCTGHALAAGALLLLASDYRVGAAGEFKIGLNEISIGMPVPVFATELARDRLSPRHFTRATALADIYEPDQAVEAGYLDEVVPADDVDDRAQKIATYLADNLSRDGFRATRSIARGATISLVRSSLDTSVGKVRAETESGVKPS